MSELNPILAYADSYRLMARDAKNQGRLETVSMWSVVADLERNIAPILDRVTAERDAALRQVETVTADRDAEKRMKAKARIQRGVQTAKAADLQERLTAADELEVALAGMLFAFDDGVGLEWSEDLLDFARKLTAAKEFKAALKPAEGGGDGRI